MALDRIGAAPLEHVVEARPEEFEPLARRLGIPAVRGLRCAFRLRRVGGSVIEAEGDLEAEVVQVCVVTLDEFAQPLREQFAVQFVPLGAEAPDDDLAAPDQIAYEDGAIDLGEAAAEQLALALDPYPHRPGAELPSAEPAEDQGPFASLAAFSRKQ